MTAKASSSSSESNPADPGGTIQAAFDKAEDRGYFGKTVDETPRENYTVAGVIAGKPTPETTKEGRSDW
jgi:hypothetical protein